MCHSNSREAYNSWKETKRAYFEKLNLTHLSRRELSIRIVYQLLLASGPLSHSVTNYLSKMPHATLQFASKLAILREKIDAKKKGLAYWNNGYSQVYIY